MQRKKKRKDIQEKNLNSAWKKKSLQDKHKICKTFENAFAVKFTFQAKDIKLNVLPKSSWIQVSDEVYEICYKISFHIAILSNLTGTKNIKSQ